jgi:hypothetical protein
MKAIREKRAIGINGRPKIFSEDEEITLVATVKASMEDQPMTYPNIREQVRITSK